MQQLVARCSYIPHGDPTIGRMDEGCEMRLEIISMVEMARGGGGRILKRRRKLKSLEKDNRQTRQQNHHVECEGRLATGEWTVASVTMMVQYCRR